MKQLLLFAIVAAGLIGATTAFASGNVIGFAGIQNFGASDDKNILTDLTLVSVNFSMCQNYGNLEVPTSDGTGLTTPLPACKTQGDAHGQVILGITDCDIKDTTDKAIPVGEVIICKLTSNGSGHYADGTPAPPAGTVVAEGQVIVTGLEGGVTTAGVEDCSASPCNFVVKVVNPINGQIDIQVVGDVKIIAKGLPV